MADFVVQPTKKFLRIQYTAVFIVFCVAVFLYVNYLPGQPAWLLVFPGLLFLFPATGSIRLRFTKLIGSGDKLRYETGILSRTTRTIQISRIQDVTVNQTLMQRLYHIGSVSIETSGETSRLTIANIDDPQELADWLLDTVQPEPQKRKAERA